MKILFDAIYNARETLLSLRKVIKDKITDLILEYLYDADFFSDGTYYFYNDEDLSRRIDFLENKLTDIFTSYEALLQATFTNDKEYGNEKLKLEFWIEESNDEFLYSDININFTIYREDDFLSGNLDNPIYIFENRFIKIDKC